MAELPSLGRNPFNALQILSGCERQSWDNVSASAVFTRGYLGTQSVDSDGNIVWAVTANGVKPNGILNSHKASQFLKSVVARPVTLDANGVGVITPYLHSGSVYIASSTGSDITSDFVITLANGILTSVAHADETVYVSYRYDCQEPGVDETLGSGKVAIIRGVGEVSTLLYDTSAPITQGANLYCVSGILSPTDPGAGVAAAVVVKAPTYADPSLRIRINL